MPRFAELPALVRYVVIAALVVAAWFVLRWIDQEDEAEALVVTAPQVELHLKFRQGGGGFHAGAQEVQAGDVIAPLFTHVAANSDDVDPRARWSTLRVPAARLTAELALLAADPGIDEAFVAPVLELPTLAPSCPITTPSYEDKQGYLGPAPAGIDAPSMWARGVAGEGIWFADIEGGWNAKHEDLPGDRITHVSGAPIIDASWRAHGTAVLGEIAGVPNGKGVTGIAPNVERIFTSSIGNSEPAEAIDAAAHALRPGDVLLVELQGYGPRRKFVPVEYWDDMYDAIRAATDRGVVVIEAAGNGGVDLDAKIYAKKFDRAVRDSGAIMVGAGGPPRYGFVDRARLDFSNYGARVDVQGWGRRVATLDYGDLQRCDDAGHRHYTDEFSGTSSASPIVAGAAILLESEAQGRIPPAVLRLAMIATGTPQTGDLRKHIGPRPNLRLIEPHAQ